MKNNTREATSIMKNARYIFLLLMCLSIFTFLAFFLVDFYLEFILNLPRSKNIFNILEILFFIIVLTYAFSLLLSFIIINISNNLADKEKIFYRKIFIIKPISIVAYGIFENINTKQINPMLMKILYVLRYFFFFSFIISIFIIFVFPKPNDIFLILLFFCLPCMILTDLIFESAILVHAFTKDKEEWEKLNYYEYFTSAKSIFSPFSYSKYYKNNFG